MKLLDNIKSRIGEYLLQRKLSSQPKRNVKVSNFMDAKSVAVLYNATNRDNYQSILKYIRFLKEERKQVHSIGYIDSTDESQFLTSQGKDHFITKKDLSKVNLPGGKLVSEFLKTEFDILIDLTIEESLPLKYLCGLSKSRFKVSGALPYQRSCCDLTIGIDQNNTVDFLIIQLKHYLNQVNKKKHVVQ